MIIYISSQFYFFSSTLEPIYWQKKPLNIRLEISGLLCLKLLFSCPYLLRMLVKYIFFLFQNQPAKVARLQNLHPMKMTLLLLLFTISGSKTTTILLCTTWKESISGLARIANLSAVTLALNLKIPTEATRRSLLPRAA